MTRKTETLPALRGGLLALLAAVLFGISTPLIQHFGADLSSFWIAALLYAGAALTGALTLRPAAREARLTKSDLPRLAAMAACGAALAPVLLAWGLARSSATAGSLMLTLEAVFTVLLARLCYGEQLDRRVSAALILLTVGGVLLVFDQANVLGGAQWMGALAVLGATAAWGLDNTLSRGVAERDPGQVVLAKSLLGVSATGVIALASGAALPAPGAALALLAIGATGYGLSLRLYLLAQRAFGAARTASVYAFAPFLGAGAAWGMGERGASVWLGVGTLLMLAGVLLHLSERHAHEHAHESLEHEHAHRHDDGHHDHTHTSTPEGTHSHPHQHTARTHAHAHAPDLHHAHRH